jgi:Tol biopolymer transport system component
MPINSRDAFIVRAQDTNERIFVFVRFAKETETGSGLDWEGLVAISVKTGAWQKFIDNGFEARVSPDGKKLALTRENDRALYVCNSIDGSSLDKISDLGQPFHVVAWSPDGGQILVLTSKKETTSSVIEHRLLKADGSGVATLKLPDEHMALDWSWTENLLLTARRSPPAGAQLYLTHLDGKTERQLTKDGDNSFARFSPNGKIVAYLHRQDSQAGRPVDVWTVDLDGRNNRQVFASRTTKTLRCGWAPDGKALSLIILDLKKDTSMADLNFRPIIVDLEGKVIRTFQLPRREMLLLSDWSN